MKHLKKYKETSSGSTAYMFVECRQNHRYFVFYGQRFWQKKTSCYALYQKRSLMTLLITVLTYRSVETVKNYGLVI